MFYKLAEAACRRLSTYSQRTHVPRSPKDSLRLSAESLERRVLLTINISVVSSPVIGPNSTGNSGSYLNGQNLTPDGHFAIFHSHASNLGVTDSNPKKDVYWKNMWTGEIRLVSASTAGVQSNGDSTPDGISDDGRYVVFHSNATNLDPADTDAIWDVYLKDMQTGQLTLVSTSSQGVKGNQNCVSSSANTADGPQYLSGADVSGDGRFVVFDSRATNLVPNDSNSQSDVFLKDLQTGQTSSATNLLGGIPSGGSFLPRLTPDGKYAFFLSWSSDIVTGDNNNTWDFFRKDLTTGQTICVSTNSVGQIGNGESAWDYDFSPDGRYAVFTSTSSDLVSGDTNGFRDAFLKDLVTGSIRRISTDSQGQQINNATFWINQNMSPDGRYVVMWSPDPVGSDDTNGTDDIFLKDTVTGSFVRISRTQGGGQTNGPSYHGNITSDGKVVVFQSLASNIVSGDNNGNVDVFKWQNTPPVTVNDSLTTPANVSIPNLSGKIVANDSDVDGQILLPVIVTNPSHGTIVTQPDGSWVYQPSPGYSGSDQFTYRASDGPDQGNTATVSINVTPSQASTSVGVFRNGYFYLDASGNKKWDGTLSGDVSFGFGSATDLPLTGDWNGDGETDAGVFRNGYFYLDANGNHKWDSTLDSYFGFGAASDKPISGDWNGDGKTDIGVFRNGTFYLDVNGNHKWDGSGDVFFRFGNPTDTPITGDWNGDGKTDVGTFRNGAFYLDGNGSRKWDTGDVSFGFGSAADLPITGDWNGDGKTDVGIFRGGFFYLDSNANRKWNGAAGGDSYFGFGSTGDKVVSGNWSGSALPASSILSELNRLKSDESVPPLHVGLHQGMGASQNRHKKPTLAAQDHSGRGSADKTTKRHTHTDEVFAKGLIGNN